MDKKLSVKFGAENLHTMLIPKSAHEVWKKKL